MKSVRSRDSIETIELLKVVPCVVLGRHSDSSSDSSSSYSSSSGSDYYYKDYFGGQRRQPFGASPTQQQQLLQQQQQQQLLQQQENHDQVMVLYNMLQKWSRTSDVGVYKKLLNERQSVLTLLRELDVAKAIREGRVHEVLPQVLTQLSGTSTSGNNANQFMLFCMAMMQNRPAAPVAQAALVAPAGYAAVATGVGAPLPMCLTVPNNTQTNQGSILVPRTGVAQMPQMHQQQYIPIQNPGMMVPLNQGMMIPQHPFLVPVTTQGQGQDQALQQLLGQFARHSAEQRFINEAVQNHQNAVDRAAAIRVNYTH
eukprot:Protomagalhaensia_sp_Gyna_25__1385@NODE_169_length_4673_cov_67_729823_g132_i0_p3_GENE_NODE_169_length_4673_cov_67_729823_g132_i0NODE_169_length_4673_cov_67_729823_g132_i0_p3_ORF_typecomplete_len312_score46_72DUF3592/PF12158_8/0_018DUF4702/PF15774_5/0_025MMR1/PF08505_10/0_12MMR1/PF08505_10/38_NODE_169_length_4673_cov_67_729823_g132_i0991034